MNEILQVATFAGQIILENGGETYRVEETIWRICKAFGAEEAESFATPTGIMASICHDGQTYSLIKRVSKRTVDLYKIDLVNDLSRNILLKNLSVKNFKIELQKINRSERYSNTITLLFSALGAAAFAILFGGNIQDFVAAFIIGFIIKFLTIKGSDMQINQFFINSLSAAVAAFLAIIFININLAANLDQTIIGSIMLLVPGLAITNAIRDTIAGDLLSGLTRAAEAFLVAISIAVGSGAVLSFWLSNFGGI